MNDDSQQADDQDPAPLQHVDAERVPAGGDAEEEADEGADAGDETDE